MFGLWDSNELKNYYYKYHCDEDEQCSSLRVQACHLDTLKEAFSLRVPSKTTIERIMVDEHHVVAMSRPEESEQESHQWFMSIFDLQASANTNGNKTVRKFHLVERHIELSLEPILLSSFFAYNEWLVVPCKNRELLWFDKKDTRNETSTKLDNISDMTAIYSSGSSLLFTVGKKQALVKTMIQFVSTTQNSNKLSFEYLIIRSIYFYFLQSFRDCKNKN